jgi:uncharacterized protein (TIGR03083 family)
MTPTSMNDAALEEAIADEFRQLADLFDGLPASSWDAPTLCDGWRAREVVAHLTLPMWSSTPRFVFDIVRARGKVNRAFDRSAQRDAKLPTAELVDALRAEKLHAWKPPGGGHEGALVHVVIHGLDITVPSGSERRISEARMRVVLDSLTQPKTLKFFGVDLTGIELVADDIEWSLGSGATLSGSAQDLALVVSGRTLPAGHLHGVSSAQFTVA